MISLTYTHTHTHLTSPFPGLPGWAGTRKAKPMWILLKQETVSGSGISWAICKSAPCSRQIAMPAPHHSIFYRLDALPAAQPIASKHWRSQLNIGMGKFVHKWLLRLKKIKTTENVSLFLVHCSFCCTLMGKKCVMVGCENKSVRHMNCDPSKTLK